MTSTGGMEAPMAATTTDASLKTGGEGCQREIIYRPRKMFLKFVPAVDYLMPSEEIYE